MKSEKSSIPFPKNAVKPGFILFEGLDGSGKTTQLKKLALYLEKISISVFSAKEPTDLISGKKLRKILISKKTLSAEQELEYFMEDRELNVAKNILPALARNEVVLLDRYIYSNACYQGIQLGWENILKLNIKKKFPLPQRTYLFDISPRECLERLNKRPGEKSYFEKLDTLVNIEKNYKSIAKWDTNIKIIPATGSVDEVFAFVKKDLKKLDFFRFRTAGK